MLKLAVAPQATRTKPGFLVSTFEEEISTLKMYFANHWDFDRLFNIR
jgi:hypothetical protein